MHAVTTIPTSASLCAVPIQFQFFVEFRNKVVDATASKDDLVTPKTASFQFTITVSVQQQQSFMFLNLI